MGIDPSLFLIILPLTMTVQASPLMKVFGRNMELIALKRGWTLKEVADRGELSYYHLCQLRKGTARYLDPDCIEVLLKTLEVTPNDLFLPQSDVIYD